MLMLFRWLQDITGTGDNITYQYDSLGQLTREDNLLNPVKNNKNKKPAYATATQ